MSKNSFEQLEKIYNISNRIFLLYLILIKLEILGKKNTKEYKDYIQLLFLTIDEEKKLYSFFTVFPDELYYIEELLVQATVSIKEFSTVDLITNFENFDLIQKRIVN